MPNWKPWRDSKDTAGTAKNYPNPITPTTFAHIAAGPPWNGVENVYTLMIKNQPTIDSADDEALGLTIASLLWDTSLKASDLWISRDKGRRHSYVTQKDSQTITLKIGKETLTFRHEDAIMLS